MTLFLSVLRRLLRPNLRQKEAPECHLKQMFLTSNGSPDEYFDVLNL